MIQILKFHESYLNSALQASEFARIHKCKNRRFNTGTCLLCGLHFDVLLHAHAESHGYKDAYEMIRAGVVRFDYEDFQKRKRAKRCRQNNY